MIYLLDVNAVALRFANPEFHSASPRESWRKTSYVGDMLDYGIRVAAAAGGRLATLDRRIPGAFLIPE